MNTSASKQHGDSVLIIGAGGVGRVVANKCAQNNKIFKQISLASKTKSKADSIKNDVKKRTGVSIRAYTLDADNSEEVAALIKKTGATIVINVALPYQNLPIMEACLKAGAHYIDTAIHETPGDSTYSYKHQQAYQDKFKKAGLVALLGAGFDPGVTNAYCMYVLKKYFDRVRFVDILDANAGSHGRVFATNFNPEINIREVVQTVRHWRNGKWIKTSPVFKEDSIHFSFNYPVAGPYESYLMYHEELESLVKFLPGIERIRFWMTFSQNYLNHLRMFVNVGLNRIEPILYEGTPVVPVQFLKALLPDPSSLAKNYTGKTVIGCIVTGVKDGVEGTKFIYNVSDHTHAYKEVGSQGISYTAGVPAAVAAIMLAKGEWKGAGVYHVEQFNPEPFLESLSENGLPFEVIDYQPIPDTI